MKPFSLKISQVVRWDCTPLDLREEETAKASDDTAAYLEAAFGRLGLAEDNPAVTLPIDVPTAMKTAAGLDTQNIEKAAAQSEALDSFPFSLGGQRKSGTLIEKGMPGAEVEGATDNTGQNAEETSSISTSESIVNGSDPAMGRESETLQLTVSASMAQNLDPISAPVSGMERNQPQNSYSKTQDGAVNLNGQGFRRAPGPVVVREGDSTAGLLSGRSGELDVAAIERSMRDLLQMPGEEE
jgi:hypothetical protein